MDLLDQTGGGSDSLLEAPRMDAAIKVYRGGGLEKEFRGVTGAPVQRHQVSLLTIPKERIQLKVYKGGGPSDEPLFRGMGIQSFMKNRKQYESMKETGKYILKLAAPAPAAPAPAEGTAPTATTASPPSPSPPSPSPTPGDEAKDTNATGEILEQKGTDYDSFERMISKINVYFYGETTSKLKLNQQFYKTRLLVFSTALPASPDQKSPGTLGILVLTVNDGWTLSVPGDPSDTEENADADADANTSTVQTLFLGS